MRPHTSAWGWEHSRGGQMEVWGRLRAEKGSACIMLCTGKVRTVPGCVGQGEAAPLEVDAAVHHQLSEQQGRVPGRSARGVSGGGPRRAPRGAPHESHEPGQPVVLRDVLRFRLLGALCAQPAHGRQTEPREGPVRAHLGFR